MLLHNFYLYNVQFVKKNLLYLIGCTGIRNIIVALKNRGDISSVLVKTEDL